MDKVSKFDTRTTYRGLWPAVVERTALRHGEFLTSRAVAARYHRGHLATVLIVHEIKQEMDQARKKVAKFKAMIEESQREAV